MRLGAVEKEIWKPYEVAKLKSMLERGMDANAIALILGRSYQQVKGKIRWESMTEEQRQERRDRINARRKGEYKTENIFRPEPVQKVSPEALAERSRRLAAPQTLTGFLCGDPPVGFSALERRA